jgi:hypothetical protein
MEGMKQSVTPEQERAMVEAMMKQQKPYEFNEKHVGYQRNQLIEAIGKQADSKRGRAVIAAYDSVIREGGTPEMAYKAAAAQMNP